MTMNYHWTGHTDIIQDQKRKEGLQRSAKQDDGRREDVAEEVAGPITRRKEGNDMK